MTATRPTTLDELLEALRAVYADLPDESPAREFAIIERARGYGLPTAGPDPLDWSSLPTFGGDEPRDTTGVWSWDATRLLVGDDADLTIVRRDEWAGA